MRYLTSLILLGAALLGGSCIKNDIPYPTVELSIFDITGEGFTVSDIDDDKLVVTLSLDEETDIQAVDIDEVLLDAIIYNTTLSDEELLAQVKTSRELTGTFDLRTPIYVTLSLYQEYLWEIRAEQHIDYRFAVAGQVGKTTVDEANHTMKAYVAKDTDRTKVTVLDLKLGPDNITTYSPTLKELSGSNFESVRFVDVTCHDRTERWLLYVQPTDKTVELTHADAWSRVIWLNGEGIENTSMGFRYRKKGMTEWLPVTPVKIEGGTFSAHIDAEPETEYEVVAFCDTEETEPASVKTDGVMQLPNTGFEDWCKIGKIVYPYAEGADSFWNTGNKGAAIANETLTNKGEPRPGSGGQYGADLQSKFVSVLGAGKFAAGNLFVGNYVDTDGTQGMLTFGRSFTMRPTALRIWVKYNRGLIDHVKGVPAGVSIKEGDPDNGHIYVALGTWTKEEYGRSPIDPNTIIGTDDSPVFVHTKYVQTFFDPKGKDVVGYGQHVLTESVGEWKKIEIPIVYNTNDVRPTNIMVVCSASRYGDYFTGSTKSHMWLDDAELVYEYIAPAAE